MTKKQKKTLRRILSSTVLFAVVWAVTALASLPPWWEFLLYLLPYALIGWDILWKAVRNIKNGQVFDENFLMALATVGAFGCGEYREGVAVMLFYQVGELFQSVAVSRSRASIAQLMDIRPDSANVERDGQVVTVDPEEVAVDEIIVIRAGERVPLDGTVVEGASATTFHPEGTITREQVATLLARYLEEKGIILPDDAGAPARFQDTSSISGWPASSW